MHIEIRRTTSDDTDFKTLIQRLDEELLHRYGEMQAFFDQFNKVDKINEVVILMYNGAPAGCGAFKELEHRTAEVKRMYVVPLHRGKQFGTRILDELERWARELAYQFIVLETGKNQPEAIALYRRAGYNVIANYGQYIGVELSVCMQKSLITTSVT